jgi:hypothetical protein
LVNPLDSEDAGHFSNVGQNGFELAAVNNFQTGLDASILTIGAALETSNVGASSADDRGDFRQ